MNESRRFPKPRPTSGERFPTRGSSALGGFCARRWKREGGDEQLGVLVQVEADHG